MVRRFPVTTYATALILGAATTAASASLRTDVQKMIRNAPLKGAKVAVSVRDAETGLSLVSINAGDAMIPASNMKLITTGAALHVLGADFSFHTRMILDGQRLTVVGDGDPAFGDPELLEHMSTGDDTLDVESFLKLWVDPVVKSGVTRIDELVIDDRMFDREFVHESWPVDQINKSYCAQVSGFNFHTNVLHFFPKPRAGQPPEVTYCRPASSWLRPHNGATSRIGPKDRNTIWIARKAGTNDLSFRGNVKFAYKTPVPVTIHDVPEFFGHLLADRLTRAGVVVDSFRVARSDDPPHTPLAPPSSTIGETVGPVITTPLSTVITRCNQDSENLYAECMLKRVGYAVTGEPGSWVNGSAVIRHVMHQRLNDPGLLSGNVIADGSGLSQGNRITAAAMTAWLESFHHDKKLGGVFFDSLAMAGESGTLKKRFRSRDLYGAVIQGKTGYINGVSCLSGVITMPTGERRCFSILVNGLDDPATVPVAKRVQEEVIEAVARDMAATAITLGGE